jgi:hypothetical protein
MGTSGSSKGSGSNTSLVPTWLNQQPSGPLPGGDPAGPPDGDGDEDGDAANDGDGGNTADAPDAPPIRPPPEAGRFLGARRNFSSFASSGGRDTGALRRAVRDYVRSGTRGGANAARRMGSSRAAGSNVLGVFRGIERNGVDATLRYLNLTNLAGRSPEDVFLGLTDVVCADGGSIDEGIARDAWLETVAELESLGIDDIDALTPEQMQEFFVAFVTHSIETHLLQEIGARGLGKAADLDAIEGFERQLRDYIRRSVRDSFSGDMGRLNGLSDKQIRDLVDQTYREAWDLLEAWGDAQV